VSSQYRPGPIASWDTGSGSWLDANGMNGDLFGQSEPFSGTWPVSGMTRNGVAYPQPTRAHPTAGSGSSSLLPTPAAGNFNDGETLESWEARRQANLAKGINGNGQGTPLAIAAQQLLPTPEASDATGGRVAAEMGGQRPSGSKRAVTVATAVTHLLKTPTAQLATNGGSQDPEKRKAGGHGPTLADQVEHQLLPTPRATDGTKGGPNQRGSSGDLMLPSAVMDLLPTPAARDWWSGQSNIMDRNARPLNEVVEMLLPTPTASTQDRTPEEAAERHRPGRAMGRNGGASPDLASVAALLPTPTARLGDGTSRGADPARYKGPQSLNGRRSNLDDCIAAVETKAPWLLPTPTVADSRNTRNATAGRTPGSTGHHSGTTLSDVFWSGGTTPPPSAVGKPSSEGQPHRQLSLDEQDSA